jgi:hypothetical protein
MSIITTLYNALETDTELKSILANSTINPEKKAIYDHWADNETLKPYIVIQFDFGESYHWAKRETLLTVDIFTDGDTVQAEHIRNLVILRIDREILIDPEDGAFIRCYLNGDRPIDEAEADEITHWNIDFSLHHWRNSFVQTLEE